MMTAARKLNRKNILAKYKDMVDVYSVFITQLTSSMSIPKHLDVWALEI
jgi:hypothetical protein